MTDPATDDLPDIDADLLREIKAEVAANEIRVHDLLGKIEVDVPAGDWNVTYYYDADLIVSTLRKAGFIIVPAK